VVMVSRRRRRGPELGFDHDRVFVYPATVRRNAEFPAPPKAHREPKSGNQSRTFR
jgi:hypothetical protein